MTEPDARHMARALALAEGALGQTWPNPAVGCVIVSEGAEVGAAATALGGRPHAEPQALAQVGAAAEGATAYVTLEPCAHHGQTPPCAQALIDAGVARVVIACKDPDPRVSGRGVAILEAAGVAVTRGIGATEAREILRGFFHRTTHGRPALTLKLAQTLDGRIALGNGQSRWITGPEARAHVHRLRAQSDAILIGAGTARADDPMLDVREGAEAPRPPVRIVADTGLSLSQDSKLAGTARTQPLWLLHGPNPDPGRAAALSDKGARLIEVPTTEGGALDMTAALHQLGDEGLTSILCEGGGGLAASLIAKGLVTDLLTILNGKVIGGDGHPAIGPLGLTDLASAPQFTPHRTMPLGDDIAIHWRPTPNTP